MQGPVASGDSPLLEVQDLSVGFAGETGTVEVTSGVSFALAAGQTLSLVGESGCGKSVTAGAIMQLLPRGGKGALRRRPPGGPRSTGPASPRALPAAGSEMAMIFQEPMTSLNPVHTALDQVEEVLKLHRPEILRSERRAHAVRLLEEVEIPAAARRGASYPFQLSGGMRQRVMIAMALAGRPRLLIADEPTTALDVTVQAQILELLKRVRSEYGMGMLYITHDMAVVAEIADQVVVMYAGQVMESGAARQVFRHPLHPYTKGLLECAPRLDSKPRTRLQTIPGAVPAPQEYPSHCPVRGSLRPCRCRLPGRPDPASCHR